MHRSARMSDVAKLAGVSTMTVSRVLNDSANVTDDTRDRVTKAVEQLQYQRNEIARSLREQTSRQIGILIPNLYDPFFAICAHAISVVVKDHTYSMVLSSTDEDPRTEYEQANSMLRRGIDGLVVIPTASVKGLPSLHAPEFEHLPIVTLDRPIEGSQFDRVLVQNKIGAQLGVDHLIQLGHKHIAFFGLSGPLYTMRTRLQGYKDAMLAKGLRSEVILVSDVLRDTQTALRDVLATRHPPTALFGANNLITRHLLHGLQALGLHPPNPLALVGFDDFESADLLRPGITVVRQPAESMGRLAGELLFARLAKGGLDAPVKKMMLSVELIIRGSCGGKV
jgi:LacI family transcriptional regulator